jgi:hypothetical protein
MPPPKLPLTTIAEHDPIYPYQTLLVLRSLLAMTVPTARRLFRSPTTRRANAKTRDFQHVEVLRPSVGGPKRALRNLIRVHFQYRPGN